MSQRCTLNKTTLSLFPLCNFAIQLLFTLLHRSEKCEKFRQIKSFSKNFFACTQLWCSQILSFCSFHSIMSMLMTMTKIETYRNHVSHMEIPLNAQLNIQLRTWLRVKLLMGSNVTCDALQAVIIQKIFDCLIHFLLTFHILLSLILS